MLRRWQLLLLCGLCGSCSGAGLRVNDERAEEAVRGIRAAEAIFKVKSGRFATLSELVNAGLVGRTLADNVEFNHQFTIVAARDTAAASCQMLNRMKEELEHATSIPPIRLRAPFRAFWYWWGFWALSPVLGSLAERAAGFGRWPLALGFMLCFFWSGSGPIRVWIQRPRPVWLFFVLWMFVPLALSVAVAALWRSL